MCEIIIAGVGTGGFLHLTPEVQNAIKDSDTIIASKVHTNLIPSNSNKNIILLEDFKLKNVFKKISELKKVLILVSGDTGIFSLMPLIKKNFPNANIKVMAGLSAMQILCAKLNETWNDAIIFSGHGRILNIGEFLNTVERNEKVILFCDNKNSPDSISRIMDTKILDSERKLKIFIGEDLDMPSEKIYAGTVKEFVNKDFSSYSIMLIKNSEPFKYFNLPRDFEFERLKNIPMTNENTRQIILSRLDFSDGNKIFWDIGAGTGSISISVALKNLSCEVHAIELKEDAVNLIKLNAAKFKLHNIKIHSGRAENIIKNLPVPQNIFIGGSGGALNEILDYVINLDASAKINIVLACVTPENFNIAYEKMKLLKNFECVQIQANYLKSAGEKFFMSSCNPVLVLSCNKL